MGETQSANKRGRSRLSLSELLKREQAAAATSARTAPGAGLAYGSRGYPNGSKSRDSWEEALRFKGKMELSRPPTAGELLALTDPGCNCYSCRVNREAAKRLS